MIGHGLPEPECQISLSSASRNTSAASWSRHQSSPPVRDARADARQKAMPAAGPARGLHVGGSAGPARPGPDAGPRKTGSASSSAASRSLLAGPGGTELEAAHDAGPSRRMRRTAMTTADRHDGRTHRAEPAVGSRDRLEAGRPVPRCE